METERRPVAKYLQNRASIEREHVEQIEQGNTELRTARFFLGISNRVRNSRIAVVGLLAGLSTLVAADLIYGDDIPEPISAAMDMSQIVISGALIGAAVRPVSRSVDGGFAMHDEFVLSKTLEKAGGGEMIIGDTVLGEDDSKKIQEVRAALANYARDLVPDSPGKREIGETTGNDQVDDIRHAVARKLSHMKELPFFGTGTIESYVERGQVSDQLRKDPRLDTLDKLRDDLTSEEDRAIGKKRIHSDVLDGIALLFMEAQVMSEKTKQQLNILQKKALVISGDFVVGIASMYGLVASVGAAAGENYKGLAYFSDDALGYLGIALTPAFKKLLSTQTGQDIIYSGRSYVRNAKSQIASLIKRK